MKESFINLFSGYEHFIGGFAGGFASTIFCHPFDLLKVRFSANDGSSVRPQYKSYWQAARIIHAANGIPGLYRGITPTVIAAPLSWGLYFQLYDQIRSSTNTSPKFPIVDNLLAGTITGAVVLSITNPFWVCKTRMCLQYENRGPAEVRYSGLVDCWMKIWRKERWRGLYSGFVPGLFGTVNGAVQFAIYNWLKDWRCRKLGIEQDSQLQPQDYLVFSTLSKCMSTIITFPYQLVRTRLQDPHTKYAGTTDCIKRTWQREGPFGLYKGVLAATVKQLPYSIITYVVYEQTRYFFERHNKGME